MILGGTRSGKSTLTEPLLSDKPGVSCVATSKAHPDGPEWVEWLRIYRACRPSHWETVETIGLATEPRRNDVTPMLVDYLGVWLTRLLDDSCWGRDPKVLGCLENWLEEFLVTLRATRRPVVFTSSEVGLGVAPATSSGRLFTDQLGCLNTRVATVADRV